MPAGVGEADGGGGSGSAEREQVLEMGEGCGGWDCERNCW